MRFRPKYLALLRPCHCIASFRTFRIFSPHHFVSSKSLPIGTPSDLHHPFSGAHAIPFPCFLNSCCMLCPLYVPIASPSLFLMFSLIPVASHHLFTARIACCSSLMLVMNRVVSSANWDILKNCSPILIPLRPFSEKIAILRACATIRNSSGLSGHPCATPLFIPNTFLDWVPYHP